MTKLKSGLKGRATVEVTKENTALTMGSGDMEVFATPALVALMEKSATKALEGKLPEGATTVGSQIDASHLRPSLVGANVSAEAEVKEVQGRRLAFKIVAKEGKITVGEATHVRYIVDREQFLSGIK